MKRIILSILVSLIALPAAAAYNTDAEWTGKTRLDTEHNKLECEFHYQYKNHSVTNKYMWSTSMEHGKSPVCPAHLRSKDGDGNWHVGDLGWDGWNAWKKTSDYELYKSILIKEKAAYKAEEGGYTWITAPNNDIVRVLNEDYADYYTRIRTNTAESPTDFLYEYADKPLLDKAETAYHKNDADDHRWWYQVRYQHIPNPIHVNMDGYHYDWEPYDPH